MKRILSILWLLATPLMAQNVRWDLPITTVLAQGGNLLPLYAIPGAGIEFYSCSGSTCTTLATTYISATSSTTCPVSPTPMQVTLNGSSTCVSTADPYGNMGAWFQAGQYMATITAQGGSYNYYFTVGSGPGVGCIGGNTIANGCTGATTAAGANLNITGVTQTGTLGTSSQVSTFPGPVAAGTTVLTTGQGVWSRRGVVTYSVGTPPVPLEEPTVLTDNSPQILSGISPVWKKWYSCGESMCYGESQDGVEWTNLSLAVISSCGRSSVIEPTAGTFLATCDPGDADTQTDLQTSSDGIHWTDTYPAILPAGSPSWSQAGLTNTSLYPCTSGQTGCTAGTYYLFVEVDAGLALYTSTDGHTFTPYATLMLPSSTYYWRGPSMPYLINGTWYLWVHGEPSGQSVISRISAPSLTGPWTFDTVSMIPRTADEGAGVSVGQVADPSIVPTPDGTKTYLYYTASQLGYYLETIAIDAAGTGWATGDVFQITGCTGATGSVTAESGGVPSAIAIANAGGDCTATTGAATIAVSPSVGTGLTVTTTVTSSNRWVQETKLAVADMPMSSLVQTNEGDNLRALDNLGMLGMSYDYWTNNIDLNGHGIQGTGAATFPSLTVGCSPIAQPPCENGNAVINFDTAVSGVPYNGSFAINPNGGEGMVFTLPRDVSGEGYYFNNNAGTTLLGIDSATGNVTGTGNLTLGSASSIFWGSSAGNSFSSDSTGNMHIDASANSGGVFISGNYAYTIAGFRATPDGAVQFSVGTAGLLNDPSLKATTGTNYLCADTSGNVVSSAYCGSGSPGSGTVTSVAMTVPSWLTVTGSPVTTSGTLALTATSSQAENEFLATPNGSSGAVGLRAIVAADIPTLNQSTTGNAATATNLASYPTLCSGGQFSQGLSSGSNNCATPSGSGSVTSVGWTGGIVSVANPTTTPAFTVAGTSGGIPYFSSSSAWASSAALASGAIVTGGGAGTAPSTDANATLSTGTLSLGASGTLGAVKMGNATSGTITLEPATGALGTITEYLPISSGDTLAGIAATQTLTNKTLTSPALGGTVTGSGTIPLGVLAVAGAVNTVVGAATSTTHADLTMPSCSGSTNALIWTTGTGFGCNTISGTVTDGSGTSTAGLGLLSTTTAHSYSVSSYPMTQTVASGSLALATSAISSASCQTVTAGSVNSAAATGVATTDTIQFIPNGSIKAVTGYTPSTSGGLTITPYPTAGYVNFDVCNWSASSITPGAVTLNWRVTR